MENQGEMNRRSQNSTQTSMRQIGQALSDAVTLRGGSLTKDVLRLYVQKLSNHALEDVTNALRKLGDQKRAEFEPALPEIGVILSLVEVERIARQNRSEIKRSERLVAWTCPDCFNRMTGFPQGGDSLDRRCSAPYKQVDGRRVSLPPGQICGARMRVHLDDANTHEDGPVKKWEMSRR